MDKPSLAILILAVPGMLGCDIASLERALPTSDVDMASPSSSPSVDLSVEMDMAQLARPMDMASKPVDLAPIPATPDLSVSSEICRDHAGCAEANGASSSFYVSSDCTGQEYSEYSRYTWDGWGLVGNTSTDFTYGSYRNRAGFCVQSSGRMAMQKVYRSPSNSGCNCGLCNTCLVGKCVPVSDSDDPCSASMCTPQNQETNNVCRSGACVPGPAYDCGSATCDPATGQCGSTGSGT